MATAISKPVRLQTWLFLLAALSFAAPSYASEPDSSLEEVFSAVDGSVVLVRTRERMPVGQDSFGQIPFIDQGSGVLISKDGDVLTAAHLVQVADAVQVEFVDGTQVSATVVASEPAADLALLKLSWVPDGAVVAKLGESDAVRVGQQIFVIGAPYGLSHTLSVGRISGRHLPGTLGGPLYLAELFQADVAIHRGNSGGPMFDLDGEVVGIVSHYLSESGAFEGVGFSVTSNSIKELLLTRPSPWSGISVFALDERLAGFLNLPQEAGLLVQRVAAGSPGAQLGLLPGYVRAKIGEQELLLGGDVILDVDGLTVGTSESYIPLREHLSEIQPGQTVRVKVLRRGKIVELSAVFGEQASERR